eukprot:m.529138 g.529138  ORF g.529138 m.529138 type:complete len:335 (-) comp22016_c0_seq11:1046-2050(-)
MLCIGMTQPLSLCTTSACSAVSLSSSMHACAVHSVWMPLTLHALSQVFEIPRARFYAAEICLGLWYLHDHKVLYRDLKLDNVMLSATGHVKIADFGMCKENIPKGGRTSTFCGTPGYLAPEIIQEKPYGASVDWWALGVLMYEMMIGDSPFEADDDDELFHIICHSKPDVRSLPQSARDVVNGFLTKSPSKRLACDARGQDGVKSHPFFASIDWDKLLRQEIPPPFKPKTGKSVTDACNFDEEFTSEDPNVSPTDNAVARRLDQNVFRGFSFTTKGMGTVLGGEKTPCDPSNGTIAFCFDRCTPPRALILARYLREAPVSTFGCLELWMHPLTR